MRSRLPGLVILLSISFVFSLHPARADDIGFKSISVFAGANATNLKTDRTNGTIGFEGGAIFGITPRIAILGFFNYAAIDSIGRPLGEGTLNLTSLSAGIAYRILKKSWSPFATAGVVFQFSSFDLKNAEVFEPTGFRPEQSVDNSTGFFLGGGIHLQFSRNLGLIGMIRYAVLSTDVTVSVVDEVSGLTVTNNVNGIDLNPLWIGAGLTYQF